MNYPGSDPNPNSKQTPLTQNCKKKKKKKTNPLKHISQSQFIQICQFIPVSRNPSSLYQKFWVSTNSSMGACCSVEMIGGKMVKEEGGEDEGETYEGDFGARVRLQGFCKFATMFTKQGKKGINQDAMAIWEDFTGENNAVFCGVFDGHGPFGHKVSHHVRDVLPSKLSSELKLSKFQDSKPDEETISSCKASIIKAFGETDEELKQDSTIDAFCSGATAVAILKQGQHLVIANLGDSRAILCTRKENRHLQPIQLTVDLKPNNPSEAERIKRCNGRVFAQEEEEEVYRLWLPDEDSPGLAMARAFGDFCLKDYGLISIPEVTYRELSSNDEFIVLATDGIWDVLTNKEVVQIVTSTKKRSKAAKVLVKRAVRAWRSKYPMSKVDDCAAICLYLNIKPPTSSRKSNTNEEMNEHDKHCSSSKTFETYEDNDDEIAESINGDEHSEEWNALEGVSRVDTVVKLPRFSNGDPRQKRTMKDEDEDEYENH